MYKELYRSSGYTTDGNYIWYVGSNNEIIQANIKTGGIEYLGIVPGMRGKKYAYRVSIYHEGMLYLLPYNTDRLCIYALKDQEWSFVDFPDGIFTDSETERKLFGYVVTEHSFIFYGIHPVAVILNLKTNTYRAYRIDLSEARKKGITNIGFWRDGTEYEGKIIIPLDYSNCYFVIDINKESTGLVVSGEKYILSPFQMTRKYKSSIYRIVSDKEWNVSIFESDINKLYLQKEICSFHIKHDWIPTKGQAPFACGEIIDGLLYLLPAYQESTYVINLNTGNVRNFSGETIHVKSNNLLVRNYSYSILIDTHTFTSINEMKSKLVVFSDRDKYEQINNLKIDEVNYSQYKKDVINANYSIYEEKDFTLDDFLNYL